MRELRIVEVVYEKATPKNKKIVRKTVVPLVNKVKVTEETVMYFDKYKNYDIRRGKNISAPAKVSDIIVSDVFEHLKKLASNDLHKKEQYSGIPTGLSDLDKALNGGFHRSDLIIVGACPAMGKTSFALNVARNIAMKGKKVLFFSLELSKEQLARRVISTESQISSIELMTEKVNQAERERLELTLQNLANYELYFDDTANITVSEIKARALRMKDVDCIVIDYLQLMLCKKRSNGFAEITRELKVMAKELNIPVVVCSQLSRNVTNNNGDHRSKLTDLRKSGVTEQDADVVLMLNREDYYVNNADEDDHTNIAEIIVAKNRHGSTETVKVAWNPEFTMFSNIESED